MPVEMDLSFYRGDDYRETWGPFLDYDGNALDLSTATLLRVSLRLKSTDVLTVQVTSTDGEVVGNADGTVEVWIPKEDTEALGAPAYYLYDLEVVLAGSGDYLTLQHGQMILLLDVTRISGTPPAPASSYYTDMETDAAILAAIEGQPYPNVVWDPFHQYVGLSLTTWGGVPHWWYSAAGDVEIVAADGDNPYDAVLGKTLHLKYDDGAEYAGKILFCREIGCAIGDKLSFVAQVRGTNGEQVYLGCRFHDGSNWVGAEEVSATLTLNGNVQTMHVTSVPNPGSCDRVYVYVKRSSGTNTISIYGMWGKSGDDYTLAPSPSVAPTHFWEEIIAARGNVANLNARLAAVIDSDGNLLAQSSPNFVWDPFFISVGESQTAWGGVNRWYGMGYASIITDAANPFAGKTMRIEDAGGNQPLVGKRMTPGEIGLQNGGIVSVGIMALIPVGCEVYLDVGYLNSGGTWCAGANAHKTSAVITGDGTTKTIKAENKALTATNWAEVQTLALLIRRNTVADQDIDVYCMWGNHGATLAAYPTPGADTDIANEVIAARGARDSLDERISQALDDNGDLKFPASMSEYGRHHLKSWWAELGKISSGSHTGQPRVAFLGDSWIGFMESLLRPWMVATFGDAAGNWFGFGQDWGGPGGLTPLYLPSDFQAISRTGTWAESEQEATSRGVDLSHMSSTDFATPASVTIQAVTEEFHLHYLKQTNGGTFEYQVDGAGGWTEVDTANAGNLFASLDITGLSNASHTLVVKLKTNGAAGVLLMGVWTRLTAEGVVPLDMGNGGSATLDWSEVDETIWQAGLTAVDPDLVVICLGVNDHNYNESIADYTTQLTTLIDRIQAACPLAGILLLTPAAVEEVGHAVDVGQFVTAMRDLAVTENCACLDLLMYTDTYTNANTRGLIADPNHLSTAGWYLVCQLIERFLINA